MATNRKMEKNTDQFIGCKANFRLKAERGDFTGEIQAVDREKGTITFHKVTIHHPGEQPKVLCGLQTYYQGEFADLDLTGDVNEGLRRVSLGTAPYDRHQPKLTKKEKEKGLRHSKEVPRHLENMQDLDLPALYMRTIVDDHMKASRDENGQYESALPARCTLLDDCKSDLFKRAIAHLMECSTVGVAFAGINLGRKGQLCWMMVSTGKHTMMFDTKTMGKEGFDAGLAEFLQSPETMKVVHDCRRSSDLLYHQYNIKMMNVFDTQVGAVNIHKLLNKGSFPRYVTSLAECLRNELGVSDEDIHFPLLRDINPEVDEEIWNIRPAPTLVYKWLHSYSRFLLPLQEKQMTCLLMEFTVGVDIYLQNLRDANTPDFESRISIQHLLPTEFGGIPLIMQAKMRDIQMKKKRVSRKYIASATKDEQGWTENCAGIVHPKVIGSHDTIWHSAANLHSKSDTYPNKRQENRIAENGSNDKSKSKNGSNDQSGSSTPATPKASGTKKDSHSPSTDGSPADKNFSSQSVPDALHAADSKSSVTGKTPEVETAEVSQRQKVSTLIDQVIRAYQEKENGETNVHNIEYVFRPAGETVQSVSKKKDRQMKAQTQASGDLAGKTVKSYPVPDSSIEDEFDAIPSQKKLAKHRSQQVLSGRGFMIPQGESKDFKDNLMTFEEKIPPPPYTISAKTENMTDAERALAAILPRVEDESELLEGTRCFPSRLSKLQFKDSPAVKENAKPDMKPAVPHSDTSNHMSSCGGLLKGNEPTSAINSNGVRNCALPTSLMMKINKAAAKSAKTTTKSTVPELGRTNANKVSPTSQSPVAVSSLSPTATASYPRAAAARQASPPFAAQTTATSTAPEHRETDTHSLSPTPQSPVAVSNPCSKIAASSLTSLCDSHVSKSATAGDSCISSSPAARSPGVQSPPSRTNLNSIEEVKAALEEGKSLWSILGFNLTPQEMMAERIARVR